MISVKNLVSNNSATVLFSYLLKSRLINFFRYVFWSTIVTLLLLCFNLPILERLRIIDFFGLLLPYLISLWIWLLLLDFTKRNPKKILLYLILALLHCMLSVYGVYLYFYELLPQYDIVLFTRPMEGQSYRFFARSATAHLIFGGIVIIDYFFWNRVMLNIQVFALEKQTLNQTKNNHLSIHFTKSLLSIVKRNKIDNSNKVYNFFQYIITNILHARSYVALEEEWRNLKMLISICTHRRVELYGEDILKDKDWNRSVPALCLLTWMENAITYSPSESDFPIELRWSSHGEGLQLVISNQISKSAINMVKTGQGLKLLDAIFVDTNYDVHYKESNDQKFEVKFTLK